MKIEIVAKDCANNINIITFFKNDLNENEIIINVRDVAQSYQYVISKEDLRIVANAVCN
jgi:hypothetical protein